jgi:hypothetical protein
MAGGDAHGWRGGLDVSHAGDRWNDRIRSATSTCR